MSNANTIKEPEARRPAQAFVRPAGQQGQGFVLRGNGRHVFYLEIVNDLAAQIRWPSGSIEVDDKLEVVSLKKLRKLIDYATTLKD